MKSLNKAIKVLEELKELEYKTHNAPNAYAKIAYMDKLLALRKKYKIKI